MWSIFNFCCGSKDKDNPPPPQPKKIVPTSSTKTTVGYQQAQNNLERHTVERETDLGKLKQVRTDRYEG
jgi:hypothetical protein